MELNCQVEILELKKLLKKKDYKKNKKNFKLSLEKSIKIKILKIKIISIKIQKQLKLDKKAKK